MDECLSRTDIELLLGGNADADLVNQGLLHLEKCWACRECAMQTAEFADATSSLRDLLAAMRRCPDYDRIASYLEGTLSRDEMAALDSHFEHCSDCEEDLEYLQQAASRAALIPHRTFAPAERRRRMGFGFRGVMVAGLAAGAVAVALLVFSFSPHQTFYEVGDGLSEAPSARSIPSQSKDEDISLRDQMAEHRDEHPSLRETSPRPEGRVHVSPMPESGSPAASGHDSGPKLTLPSELMTALDAKMKTGRARLDRPVMIARVPMDVLRDPGRPIGVEPGELRPHGIRVLTSAPVLSWVALERVESFQVQVYTEEGVKVWETVVKSTQCSPDRGLKRGHTYVWRVGACIGDEVFYSRPATFRMLAEDESERVSQVLKQYPGSHLIRGTTLEFYGVYDLAMEEFRMLEKEDPDSEQTRRMIAGLEQAMEEAERWD